MFQSEYEEIATNIISTLGYKMRHRKSNGCPNCLDTRPIFWTWRNSIPALKPCTEDAIRNVRNVTSKQMTHDVCHYEPERGRTGPGRYGKKTREERARRTTMCESNLLSSPGFICSNYAGAAISLLASSWDLMVAHIIDRPELLSCAGAIL